jgi:hypothetical protein
MLAHGKRESKNETYGLTIDSRRRVKPEKTGEI